MVELVWMALGCRPTSRSSRPHCRETFCCLSRLWNESFPVSSVASAVRRLNSGPLRGVSTVKCHSDECPPFSEPLLFECVLSQKNSNCACAKLRGRAIAHKGVPMTKDRALRSPVIGKLSRGVLKWRRGPRGPCPYHNLFVSQRGGRGCHVRRRKNHSRDYSCDFSD